MYLTLICRVYNYSHGNQHIFQENLLQFLPIKIFQSPLKDSKSIHTTDSFTPQQQESKTHCIQSSPT
ncbi:hypothetical protein Fmac_025003 [Flemingia macrophylla]|uniref:Uncharacterized protein n=1 Tax=Flemingia macrophylla TaxID=520843 RepID=A0ABD1LR01_9FABA